MLYAILAYHVEADVDVLDAGGGRGPDDRAAGGA